jgi:hypothetical protein
MKKNGLLSRLYFWDARLFVMFCIQSSIEKTILNDCIYASNNLILNRLKLQNSLLQFLALTLKLLIKSPD